MTAHTTAERIVKAYEEHKLNLDSERDREALEMARELKAWHKHGQALGFKVGMIAGKLAVFQDDERIAAPQAVEIAGRSPDREVAGSTPARPADAAFTAHLKRDLAALLAEGWNDSDAAIQVIRDRLEYVKQPAPDWRTMHCSESGCRYPDGPCVAAVMDMDCDVQEAKRQQEAGPCISGGKS